MYPFDAVHDAGISQLIVSSPDLVHRPRVDRLLNAAADARLALLAAPPGRGVSTALRQWSAASWHALFIDVEQLEAASRPELWSRILRLAAHAGLRVDDEPLEHEHGSSVEIAQRFSGVDRRTTLVVDHLDAAPDAADFAAELVQLAVAVPRVHVLVSARSLEEHGLSAALSPVDTVVVDPAAFDFTADETAALFERSRVGLPAEHLEALRRLCHGNAALLASAAAMDAGDDLRPSGIAAFNGHVRSRVLAGWSARADFDRLLALSVPDRIEDELVEAGDEPTGALLADLVRAGLGGWSRGARPRHFRLDPLFRLSLEQELEHRSPARRAELRQRTIRRAVREREPLDAIRLAVEFGEWALVRSLLRAAFDEVVDELVADDEFALALIGSKQYAADPLLAIVLGLHEVERGSYERASRAFLVAVHGTQAILDREGELPAAGEYAVARLARFIAFSQLGRVAQAAREAGLLETMLGEIDEPEAGIRPMRATVHREIADFALRDLRHGRARRHLAAAGRSGWERRPLVVALGALEAAADGDVRRAEELLAPLELAALRGRAAVNASVAAALVAIEAGEFDRASELLDGLGRAEAEVWPIAIVARSCVRVCDEQSLAVFDAERARHEAQSPSSPRMRRALDAQRRRLLMQSGHWGEAFRVVEQLRPNADAFETADAALCALVAGDLEEAVVFAERFAWNDAVSMRERTAMLVIAAAALQGLGHEDTARERIAEAAALAAATGTRTPLGLIPRSILTAVAPELAASVRTKTPEPPRVVQLSRRERAVLLELEQTGTLSAIAERLSVSVNTVRTQLSAVYRKLGVSSRQEALRAVAAGAVIVRTR